MKKIYVGIYYKDRRYGKRLMEYLNHQREYPMTVWFTSDEEKFFQKEKDGCFQCLILAEETVYGGVVPTCRIERGCAQSGPEIARNIYGCLQMTGEENRKIFGVYSPFEKSIITDISLELAKQRDAVYFGMRAYHRFAAGTESTDELLFHIKEQKEESAEFFLSHTELMEGVKGYPGASCYLDYLEPTMEDYRYFFKCLKSQGLSLVLDMETACIPGLSFFELFDRVYIPLTEPEVCSRQYFHFTKQMKKYGVWNKHNIEEIFLGMTDSAKEVVKRL